MLQLILRGTQISLRHFVSDWLTLLELLEKNWILEVVSGATAVGHSDCMYHLHNSS